MCVCSEQFTDCMEIGKELVRLLQNVARLVPCVNLEGVRGEVSVREEK